LIVQRGQGVRPVSTRLIRRAFSKGASLPPPGSDALGDDLIGRWRKGDQSAFADLFKAYRGLVYGVLFHLMPHDPELEDVVQTAFLEVYRSLGSFEGRSKLGSWIARVALHVGYHHLRRKRSRPPDYAAEAFPPDLVDESAGADPERLLEQKEAMRRVHAILGTIGEKKRTVFLLNDLQGLSQEDVAEIVGTNLATVRTRLFYARKEFWEKAKKDPILARLPLTKVPDSEDRGGE
jgi:RNA polymerase sigma-70 factor, ECF subfamily